MSFSIPDRDLESHTDCDDLSKIVQVLPNDSADVCCLQKTSIVDKLLDNRKNEFKLPTLKTKMSSCVLTSEENLKIVQEKEMKKNKEEEKAQRRVLQEEKKKKKKRYSHNRNKMHPRRTRNFHQKRGTHVNRS